MHNEIKRLTLDQFPSLIKEITDPPKQLYIQGELPDEEETVFLAVVGSRKYTSYGKDVCERLIEGLRGYPVVIISGLALGIDSIAHKKALEVGLKTIAIPGSGLDENVLYPATNIQLARKIIEQGGCLLSEFEPDFRATTWSFPQRNRLMAGISHGVLIVEAEEERSQRRNKETALLRMNKLIESALKVQRRRIPTKPSRAAKEKRLQEKKIIGRRKKERSKNWKGELE